MTCCMIQLFATALLAPASVWEIRGKLSLRTISDLSRDGQGRRSGEGRLEEEGGQEDRRTGREKIRRRRRGGTCKGGGSYQCMPPSTPTALLNDILPWPHIKSRRAPRVMVDNSRHPAPAARRAPGRARPRAAPAPATCAMRTGIPRAGGDDSHPP